MRIPRSLSQKPQKSALHIEFYTKTVERPDLEQTDHGTE